MRKITTIALGLLAAACMGPNGRPNDGVMNGGGINSADVGTVLGGIGGGVLGNHVGRGSGRTFATIAGTLLGAGLGNAIGTKLDKADMVAYHEASQEALEAGAAGEPLPWRSQGAAGTITPAHYYQNAHGQYCREYTQTITIENETQQGYGTACRQVDGTWKIISD